MSQTFLYFAYGSNMLTKRIHINNPTAIQKTIGILKDHRLDFMFYSKRWKGAAATIIPDPDSHVWGVVWKIDISNMPDLDNQEGVKDNVYFPKNVSIETVSGEKLECRVYQQCRLPDETTDPKYLPPDRQPSLVYLNTLIKGAKEFNIPNEYVNFLKSFKHNGYEGEINILLQN